MENDQKPINLACLAYEKQWVEVDVRLRYLNTMKKESLQPHPVGLNKKNYLYSVLRIFLQNLV